MAQKRIYKRGNDEIDLDSYIRKAESNFDYWLSTQPLKEKDAVKVRQAYKDLLNGINEQTLTYNLGGGYKDISSNKYTNATKGTDYYGIAAGYLGSTLRKMNTKSENKDSDKTVSKYISKRIFGTDTPSSNDYELYKKRDLPDDNGKVSNTVRLSDLRPILQDIYTNFDTILPDYSPEDKEDWIKNYEKSQNIWNDNIVTEDEYLALKKLTGFDNISDLFATYTGDKKDNGSKYPTLPLNNHKLGKDTLDKMIQVVMNLKNDQILDALQSGPTENLFSKSYLDPSQFNNVRTVENMYNLLLGMAIQNNLLFKDNDYYYYPSQYEGILYKYKDGEDYLNVADMSSVSNYQAPTLNKHGGILKADNGMSVPDIFSKDMYGKTIWDTSKFMQAYNTGNGWKFRDRTENAINTLYKDANGDIYYRPQSRSASTEDYKPGKYESVEDLEAEPYYKIQYNLFMNNDDYAKAFLNYYDNYRGESPLRQFKTVTKNNDGTETITWDIPKARKYLSPRKLDHKLGGAHDIAPGKTYYLKDSPDYYSDIIPDGYIIDPEQTEEEYDPTGLVRKYRLIAGKAQNPAENPDNPENSDKGEPSAGTNIWESYLNLEDQLKKSNLDWLPDLINPFTKLPLALWTNRQNENDLLGAMHPVLTNVGDKFSPTYGLWNTMQLGNSQGAQYLSAANKALTSSGDKEALRQHQATLSNNDAQAKVHAADYEEKKRTAGIDIGYRHEGNQARINNFNTNIKSIAESRLQRAIAKSSKRTKDYDSIFAAIDEITKPYLDQRQERQNRVNNTINLLIKKNAQNWYESVMEPLKRARNEWLQTHDDVSNWPYKDQYIAYSRQAQDYFTKLLLKLQNDYYGDGININLANNTLDEFAKLDWKQYNG